MDGQFYFDSIILSMRTDIDHCEFIEPKMKIKTTKDIQKLP